MKRAGGTGRRKKARPSPESRRDQRKIDRRPVEGKCGATGKLKFASKAKAKKELRLYGADYPVKSVYRCPACGKWHLTKQRQKRGKQD